MDDSAWGFAPFHYGRWAYRNARWVWSPGAVRERHVYARALVVFIGGSGWTPSRGEGIGWFPLGPREVYIPPYTVNAPYVQRINIAYVTNINVQVIERYNPDRVVYVNRTAPRRVSAVPREVLVQSHPAEERRLPFRRGDNARSPHGDDGESRTAAREHFARPAAQRAAVPQPPPAAVSRRVYARAVPAPAPVPFAQQQKVLAANPARPIDSAALTSLQRTQKAPPPAAVLVKPETLIRRTTPPVAKNNRPAHARARDRCPGERRPDERAGRQAETSPRPRPAAQPQVTASPPAVREPAAKSAPAAPNPKPVTPAPGQKSLQNRHRKLARKWRRLLLLPGRPESTAGRGQQKPTKKPLPKDDQSQVKQPGD